MIFPPLPQPLRHCKLNRSQVGALEEVRSTKGATVDEVRDMQAVLDAWQTQAGAAQKELLLVSAKLKEAAESRAMDRARAAELERELEHVMGDLMLKKTECVYCFGCSILLITTFLLFYCIFFCICDSIDVMQNNRLARPLPPKRKHDYHAMLTPKRSVIASLNWWRLYKKLPKHMRKKEQQLSRRCNRHALRKRKVKKSKRA